MIPSPIPYRKGGFKSTSITFRARPAYSGLLPHPWQAVTLNFNLNPHGMTLSRTIFTISSLAVTHCTSLSYYTGGIARHASV